MTYNPKGQALTVNEQLAVLLANEAKPFTFKKISYGYEPLYEFFERFDEPANILKSLKNIEERFLSYLLYDKGFVGNNIDGFDVYCLQSLMKAIGSMSILPKSKGGVGC